MVKISKEDIEKDKKIVFNELEQKSNKSINDIANITGFSRQKVWRIIKTSQNDNTIWGSSATIDDNRLGRKRFFILIKKASLPTPKEKLNSMVKRDLKKEATKLGMQLESSYFIHGSYDAIICVTAEDIKNVKMFIDSLNKLYGRNISEININEVLFPITRNGFDNPNINEFKRYF